MALPAGASASAQLLPGVLGPRGSAATSPGTRASPSSFTGQALTVTATGVTVATPPPASPAHPRQASRAGSAASNASTSAAANAPATAAARTSATAATSTAGAGAATAAGAGAARGGASGSGRSTPGGSAANGGATGPDGDADVNGDGDAAPQQAPAPPAEPPPPAPPQPFQLIPGYPRAPNTGPHAHATHTQQQAACRAQVQQDIQRMLASTKAYVRHVQGPAVVHPEALAALARPRPRPPGPGEPPAVSLPDPLEWAVWKTEQLAIARLTEERRAGEVAAEKRASDAALAAFRARKAEAEAAKAEAEARKAADEAAYGRVMGSFVAQRAAAELEEVKRRKEAERERVALARGRGTKGLGRHY